MNTPVMVLIRGGDTLMNSIYLLRCSEMGLGMTPQGAFHSPQATAKGWRALTAVNPRSTNPTMM